MGRTIAALMLREMSSTYGRSTGGYIWALIEPISGIAFLTAVFSLALRSPSIGDSFALYYATGMLPLGLFRQISAKTASAIRYSKPLLGYPRVTFIDTIIARTLLNSLTHMLISAMLIGGMVLISPSFVFLNIPQMGMSFLMAISLGLGIGTLNCFLFWRFDWWRQLWKVLMRPLFIISCVLYSFEDLPAFVQDILWWNPIVHVVGQMRMGVYATYDPTYISFIYVFVISLGTLSLGLTLLNRYHDDILYK
ncbi:ABC transporter permease [Aliiroseovarius sp. S253]|uniref:ABC transporter permease n=1 Tax=Aliiroseovarius sp. S253 TaxID=3415133 RepID=UPI003C7EA732